MEPTDLFRGPRAAPPEMHAVFETFAFISTVSCIAIFVVMYRIDRASRNDDDTDKTKQG